MSFSVLIISLIFAALEAGLSWLLLAFQPVAQVFAGVPLWVVTGIIFSIGMLITFIIILLVGAMNISDRAASFVRDHFGRTVVLAIGSIIAVLAVSVLGEMLYQANPLPMRQKKGADICFVLDYSSSMHSVAADSPEVALKRAFEEAVNTMSSDQRVSVVKYTNEAKLLVDWTQLTPENRARAINVVQAEGTSGTTSFNQALSVANGVVEAAVAGGRSVAVVMISDGEDRSFINVRSNAPAIITNGIQIHTIYVDTNDINRGNLESISDETGGRHMSSGSDLAGLTETLVEVTASASDTGEDAGIPDTLLTQRYVSRKTIINARVLRILLLFLLGFWFKFIAIICIGNNDASIGTHVLHAFIIGLIGALFVEFGYGFGLPMALIVSVFWVLMITQIVRTDR